MVRVERCSTRTTPKPHSVGWALFKQGGAIALVQQWSQKWVMAKKNKTKLKLNVDRMPLSALGCFHNRFTQGGVGVHIAGDFGSG